MIQQWYQSLGSGFRPGSLHGFVQVGVSIGSKLTGFGGRFEFGIGFALDL